MVLGAFSFDRDSDRTAASASASSIALKSASSGRKIRASSTLELDITRRSPLPSFFRAFHFAPLSPTLSPDCSGLLPRVKRNSLFRKTFFSDSAREKRFSKRHRRHRTTIPSADVSTFLPQLVVRSPGDSQLFRNS